MNKESGKKRQKDFLQHHATTFVDFVECQVQTDMEKLFSETATGKKWESWEGTKVVW